MTTHISLVNYENHETGVGFYLSLASLVKANLMLTLKHDFCVGAHNVHTARRMDQFRNHYVSLMRDQSVILLIGTPSTPVTPDVGMRMMETGPTTPPISFVATLQRTGSSLKLLELYCQNKKDIKKYLSQMPNMLSRFSEWGIDNLEASVEGYYLSKEGFLRP